MASAPNKCYTYRDGEVYRYSLRAGNNNKNSLENGRYQSRQGRNARVRKLMAMDKTMVVIQGRPKK